MMCSRVNCGLVRRRNQDPNENSPQCPPWKQCRIWQLPDLVGGIFSLGTNMSLRADSVKC